VDFIGPFVVESWVFEANLLAELQVLDIERIGQFHSSIDQRLDNLNRWSCVRQTVAWSQDQTSRIEVWQGNQKSTKKTTANEHQR
jgi:hypothetical protein